MKINSENNSENTIFIFIVFFYEFSDEITARMLTFHGRTADVTYCADVTFFFARDVSQTNTDCSIFLDRFVAFYCFKCYLGSFSRYKTVFLPNTIPPKRAEQD